MGIAKDLVTHEFLFLHKLVSPYEVKRVIQGMDCPDGLVKSGFHQLFMSLLNSQVVPVAIDNVVHKPKYYTCANNTKENGNNDGG